jgi:hypothetical protein
MKIQNTTIITNRDTVIEMSLDEMHSFSGNVVMSQESALSHLDSKQVDSKQISSDQQRQRHVHPGVV